MEVKLLSAILKNRDVYEQAAVHINFKTYGPDFEFLCKEIAEYYLNDKHATHVDVELVKQIIGKTTSSDKQAKRLGDILDAAANTEVSVSNIGKFILESKRYELEVRYSTALINHNRQAISEIKQEYDAICEATELDEVDEEGTEVLSGVDFVELLNNKANSEHNLKVLPLALGRAIGGGVSGGNHILIYGPPEVGKSALAITIAAGFLKQGAPVLYLENEEPARDTVMRFACHLSDLDIQGVLASPAEATAKANQSGYSLLSVVGLPGGTPSHIDALVRRYRPRCLVVNQLHNLHVRSENEASKRMVAAQAMRNLAKKYDMVVISVTQGDATSIGKAVLDIDDVYYSNVAIQGAVDLMLGVGMSAEMEQQGVRSISYPKNKLNGAHGHVMVSITPQLSKMRSLIGA